MLLFSQHPAISDAFPAFPQPIKEIQPMKKIWMAAVPFTTGMSAQTQDLQLYYDVKGYGR